MSSSTALDGTVALITGASSGIGEATARELAGHGATVALAARRTDRLEALADDIRRSGGTALALEAATPHLLEAAESGSRGVADLVNVSSVAGRQVRMGSGVYNATKHAVGAFGESLRQEVTGRHVRVALVEPGAVNTELAGHNRPEIRETVEKRFADVERLEAEDIADAIAYVVPRPRHVAVNEILVRPTEQQG